MSHTREEKLQAFDKVLDVLETLRVKCPWDRKQTNESLRPNTIEETYELCDALMAEDNVNICKELGDVLLHVVFSCAPSGSRGRMISPRCWKEIGRSDVLVLYPLAG